MVAKTIHPTWINNHGLTWLEKEPGWISWEHNDKAKFPLDNYRHVLTLIEPGSYTIYEDEEPWP